MQEFYRKFVVSSLIVALSVLMIPMDFIHHMVEEHHDEIHQCESDICFIKFEPNCELCDLDFPVYYSGVDIHEYYIQPITCKSRLDDTNILLTFPNLLPLNKAPPVS